MQMYTGHLAGLQIFVEKRNGFFILQVITLTTTINTYPAGTERKLAFATSIESGQHAHPCNLTRLFTVGRPTSSSHLDIPMTTTNVKPYPAVLESTFVISLCHQYRARYTCTAMQSDQALCYWLANCIFLS